MQNKNKFNSQSTLTLKSDISMKEKKNRVYRTLKDAILKSDMDKTTLIHISNLFNIHIDQNMSRPEYIVSLAEEMEKKHDGILNFILRFFPNINYKFDIALFLFYCFYFCNLNKNNLTHENALEMIAVLTKFAPIHFLISVIRHHFHEKKQNDILRFINIIDKVRDKRELLEINLCKYMPIDWKIKHCKLHMSPSRLSYDWKMQPSKTTSPFKKQ
jgi:hypothetical protein